MTDPIRAPLPLLGFAAWSGTGKTTLLRQVLPILTDRGLRIGLIKHAHHAFDIDQPGKDSYELRKAGASQVLVASARREALMIEKPEESEPMLSDLIERLDDSVLDLVLVEGFKHVAFPKLELYRAEVGKEPCYPADSNIIALACDGEPPQPTRLPVLDINNAKQVADFIHDLVRQQT